MCHTMLHMNNLINSHNTPIIIPNMKTRTLRLRECKALDYTTSKSWSWYFNPNLLSL